MSDPVAKWIAFAVAAGVISVIGFIFSLFGFWIVASTYWAARKNARSVIAGAHYILIWDVVFFGVLVLIQIVQFVVSADLILLGRAYTADLRVVLLRLDRPVSEAYLGFLLQTAGISFLAPGYVLFRFLGVAARRRRDGVK